MSSREYAALHKYIISRSRLLRRAAPSVTAVEKMIDGDRKALAEQGRTFGNGGSGTPSSDHNAKAVRHATRVFLATGIFMKLYNIISRRVYGPDKEYRATIPFASSASRTFVWSESDILL
jgi:hypothetical protein